MDPQLAAVLTALAAVLLAVAELIRQVRSTRRQIDGRMDELLRLTRSSSLAEGKLEGHGIGVELSEPKNTPKDPPSAGWRRGHN